MFKGELTEGQVRPMIGLADEMAEELMARVIKEDWSVRKIEQWIALHKRAAKTSAQPTTLEHPHQSTIDHLMSRFKSPVLVSTNAKRCW